MDVAPQDDNPTRASGQLDRPARLDTFYELAQEGVVSDDELGRIESLIEDSSWVSRWMSRSLLLFGLALLAVGVVFFFAFNWDALPDLAKLGLIQVGFAGALVAGTLRDLHSVTSRVLLVVAGVLVGVFFAVFGQIYQTGADAWTLFALWSAVLLPLAALAGTQGAWVLWGVITSIAGITWFDQLPAGTARGPVVFAQMMSVVTASTVVLIVTEMLRRRGARLNQDFPWSRALTLTAAMGALTVATSSLDAMDLSMGLSVATLFAHLAASAAVIHYYTTDEPDIVGPALVGLSWLVVVLRYVTEFVFDVVDESLVAFVVMAAITLVCTAGLVAVLQRVYKHIDTRGGEAA